MGPTSYLDGTIRYHDGSRGGPLAYWLRLHGPVRWVDVSADQRLARAYGFGNGLMLVPAAQHLGPGQIGSYLGCFEIGPAGIPPGTTAAQYLQDKIAHERGVTGRTRASVTTVGEAGFPRPYPDVAQISFDSTDLVTHAPMRFTDVVLAGNTTAASGWYVIELQARPSLWPRLHSLLASSLATLHWNGTELSPL